MTTVTFLTGEYPPMQGGVADHTAYLAKHMTPLGVRASVLISQRWKETAKAVTVGAGRLPAPDTTAPQVYPVLSGWSWSCWRDITQFLDNHQPDILHIQYQAAAFDLGGWVNWLPWYCKKRGIRTKIVTTFHDLRIPYIFPKAGPFRWKSVLALAKHSDAVICTNREDLEQLSSHVVSYSNKQAHLGQPRVHQPSRPLLTMIPLGSNIQPQTPADFNRTAWRAQYGLTDNTLLLAYFGFLNESKGGGELIEALALLRQQNGIDAHLLLIGGDVGHADPTNMAYAQQVQALIDQHNLSGVVHRTGYVDLPQVSANLMAADAVVMPYRDGVSFRRTTLIAALCHGRPVISTHPADPTFTPEIDPDENMLLTPPGDAPALAKTIIMLAENESLRSRLSTGATALGRLFDWSKIAGQTAALYQRLNQLHPNS